MGQREEAVYRQRLQALERELIAAESKKEEQEERRRAAEADLCKAQEEMAVEKERRTAIQRLKPDVAQLQDVLRAMASAQNAKQLPEPHDAVDRLKKLAREREHDLSNTERQLREFKQIIIMKQQRHEELQKETSQRMASLRETLSQEVLGFVERCQRERADMQERIEGMRQENRDQVEALKAKNHLSYRALSAEEKRSVKVTEGTTMRSHVAMTRKPSSSTKPSGKAGGKAPSKAGYSSALALPAGVKLARGAELDEHAEKQTEFTRDKEEILRTKRSLRLQDSQRAEAETNWMRKKREIEARIRSEKRQVEQFEKENQKLEQQAEHLEKIVKSLGAGKKGRPKSPRPLTQTPGARSDY